MVSLKQAFSKINKKMLIAIFASYILSLLSFLLILYQAERTMIYDLDFSFPVSRFNTLIFLSKPLLLLIPFTVGFTVLGSYLLSKAWVNDIIITTTINRKGNSVQKITKIKFLSDEEKCIFKIICDSEEEVYQNDIVRESGLQRYTVSRVLSRFEAYGIIQKERYGMTNRIILLLDSLQ